MPQNPDFQNPRFASEDFKRQIHGAKKLLKDPQLNELLQLPELAGNFVRLVGDRVLELTDGYFHDIKEDIKRGQSGRSEGSEPLELTQDDYLVRLQALVGEEVILLADKMSIQAKLNFMKEEKTFPSELLDDIAEDFRQEKINQVVLTTQKYFDEANSDEVCLFDLGRNEEFLIEDSLYIAERFSDYRANEILVKMAKKVSIARFKIWQSSKRQQKDLNEDLKFSQAQLSNPKEEAELLWQSSIHPDLLYVKPHIEAMLKRPPIDVEDQQREILFAAGEDLRVKLLQKTFDSEFAEEVFASFDDSYQK